MDSDFLIKSFMDLQESKFLDGSYINAINFAKRKLDILSRASVYQNEALYLKRYSMAKELFEALNDEVEYVNIKGVVNALKAYEQIGLRPSGDIDILVDRKNASKITGILKQLGFIRGTFDDENNLIEYGRDSIAFYSANTHQIAPFIKTTGDADIPFLCIDVNVKLDWGENRSENISVADFLSSRKEIYFNGIKLYRLSDENLMIQTILHCYKEINSIFLLHRYHGYKIKEFNDIYGLYKTMYNSLDFKSLFLRAKKYNITEYLAYVIRITSIVFGDQKMLTDFLIENMQVNINTYGLEDIYLWNLDVPARFDKQKASAVIDNNLTEKDIYSIKINNKYL